MAVGPLFNLGRSVSTRSPNHGRLRDGRVCKITTPTPIMPGQTWRDNGHKALCPLSALAARDLGNKVTKNRVWNRTTSTLGSCSGPPRRRVQAANARGVICTQVGPLSPRHPASSGAGLQRGGAAAQASELSLVQRAGALERPPHSPEGCCYMSLGVAASVLHWLCAPCLGALPPSPQGAAGLALRQAICPVHRWGRASRRDR